MSANMESVNKNAREHQAKDPVCGMMVDPHNAAGVCEYKGQTYFFCSIGCREKFKADPERFLNHEPAAPIGIQRGPKRQPVASEIVSEPRAVATGSSNPANIGLRPDPVASTTPSGLPAWGPRSAHGSDTVTYTCPMHPEIVRDGPGACPICGMALEPRVVTGEEENAELIGMQRRFWWSVVLTLPLLLLARSEFIPGDPVLSLVHHPSVAR